MLDGVPFGGAGGVMSNGDREAKTVAELALQFGLPSTGTATLLPPVSARMSNCRRR